ncbi:hypothetical protein RQP46_005660 [Phenoliferia psychrophenolica]
MMLVKGLFTISLLTAAQALPAPPVPVAANRQTATLAGVSQFGKLVSSARLAGLQSSLKALPLVDFVPGSAQVAAAFKSSRSGATALDNSSLIDAEKSGNVIGVYKTAYAAALTFLPVSQLIVVQFALDAYLTPLFYVPPQEELYGQIAFILSTATNSMLGGTVTATTLLNSYQSFFGSMATPSKGTIAPVPKDFYWGVSSSGYQSEGNQGQVIDSNFQRHVDRNETDQPYYNAVNFFERYPEDIGLAKDIGLTSYRIGIQWNRLEPKQGEYNLTALAVYKDILTSIRNAGMTPIITLDHWTYPGWQLDLGGWASNTMVTNWVKYNSWFVDAIYDPAWNASSSLEPVWLTINEAALYPIIEESLNDILPSDVPQMYERIVQVHRQIYDHIHAKKPNAMVSSNVAYIPSGANPGFDALFLDRVSDKIDYIGIDQYYGATPENNTAIINVLSGTAYNALIEPEGVYYVLDYYHRKFSGKFPLWIMENGMPTEGGALRADGLTREALLQDSVYWLQRALSDGMNVIGYHVWSLTDNYELGTYVPRFGLYTVNVVDDPIHLIRHPTPAVPAYKAITAAGGVPASYKPSRGPDPCSLINPPWSCINPVTA